MKSSSLLPHSAIVRTWADLLALLRKDADPEPGPNGYSRSAKIRAVIARLRLLHVEAELHCPNTPEPAAYLRQRSRFAADLRDCCPGPLSKWVRVDVVEHWTHTRGWACCPCCFKQLGQVEPQEARGLRVSRRIYVDEDQAKRLFVGTTEALELAAEEAERRGRLDPRWRGVA